MSTSGRRNSYHHGDLRNELIAAALALLEEEGEAGLSLRAVARRAGVSAMAPYRHFPDKEALLSAVAAKGFETLGDRLAAADAGAEGAAALGAQGGAYVAFAVQNPAVFRLMFASRGQHCEPEFGPASSRAFAILADRVASLPRSAPVEDLTLACWALVHGLAALVIDGRIPLNDATPAALAQRVTRSVLGFNPGPGHTELEVGRPG